MCKVASSSRRFLTYECVRASQSELNLNAIAICEPGWPSLIKVSVDLLHRITFVVLDYSVENREKISLEACSEVCVLGSDLMWIPDLNW